jgi:Fe2+ transport system protein FeoA
MPSTTLPLHELPPGASCIAQAVNCERAVARRLMEMGLLPGTPITITRVAPLGDPIELRVRDYALSIRRAEAAAILVVEVRQPARGFASVPSYRAG